MEQNVIVVARIESHPLFAGFIGPDRSVAMESSVAENSGSDQSNPGTKGIALDRQRFANERRSMQYINTISINTLCITDSIIIECGLF